MTPLEYLRSNSDSILLVLSLPAMVLPLLSAPRLILSGAFRHVAIVLKIIGGLLASVLLIAILQAALGKGNNIIGWILLMALVGMPVVGILANAIMALLVWKSEYAHPERNVWLYGHIASALIILSFCLKSGTFILNLKC